jgi:hypothetical protein
MFPRKATMRVPVILISRSLHWLTLRIWREQLLKREALLRSGCAEESITLPCLSSSLPPIRGPHRHPSFTGRTKERSP